MKRLYQKNFYQLCPYVRDPQSREAKAKKILWVLTRHTDFPLSSTFCLDVGCSSGIIARVLAPHFRAVIGLEYDETALYAADQDTKKRVRLVQGDAMHLPFKDESFEVVICAQVYEHVPDDKLLFEEIHRILKQEGIVFFSGPNWLYPIEPHYRLPFLHWLPTILADMYLQITRQKTHYYEQSRHFWELRRLIGRNFVIVDVSKDVFLLKFSGNKITKFLHSLPDLFWKILAPFYPNFNWILRKRR
ncbi:MAG: class I SAM-dependent methyltransferase [Anaerolineales bacterium]|nr:class I SAM-dependent methyltransferase [Anaerolineales bacterium]